VTELVIGVDSSTQSTKVEARDLRTGELVAVGRSPHPQVTPPHAEQDPSAWWTALVDAIAQLGEHRADVVALSVAGQQHGLVVTNSAGDVLRPAKLWNDTTSADIADELVTQLGAAWWVAHCGSVPGAAFTVSKLAWLAAHEPRVFERVEHVMLPHDYLTWRLTGAHVTDRGDASGTGWWSETGYAKDVIELVNLDVDALPRVLSPTEAAGVINATSAAQLGLSSDIVIGPGTGDNMAAALGLGLQAGDIAVSIGTSGTVYAVASRPTNDTTGAVAGFADATGRFLPLVCTLNAARVTDTVAQWLGTDAVGLAQLALAAPVSGGPMLVPYFDGERTPNLPHATGGMTGLRTTTTREDIALAAHDGVVCGLLAGLDALKAAGVATGGTMHLVGGGARSAAYRQRLADLAEREVLVPDTDETVATGAALQAAVIKSGRGFADIADSWGLGRGTTVHPRDRVDARARRSAYTDAAESMVTRELDWL
jgi:xylulokinase